MSAPRTSGALIDRFRRARRDHSLAVIEGFHALKHALRFDAEIVEAACADGEGLRELAAALAPDLRQRLDIAEPIDAKTLSEIAPRASRTGVIAIARRRQYDERATLSDAKQAPIVLLEEPRDMGNVGACVRVAAAADAAGIVVTGRHDPWHADAIRGAAGLHFALPVLWMDGLDHLLEQARACGRPLIAMDPEGEPLGGAFGNSPGGTPDRTPDRTPGDKLDRTPDRAPGGKPGSPPDLKPGGGLPDRAIVAFGSERQGLSNELIAAADHRVRIPMREGVSSLNLATSVAATLFWMRLR